MAEETESFTISGMPQTLRRQIEAMAENDHRSASATIIVILREFVEARKKKNGNGKERGK